MNDPEAGPDHGPGYRALQGFAAPARATPELWRIFAVLGLTILLSDLAQALLIGAIRSGLGSVLNLAGLANLTLGLSPAGVLGNLCMYLPFGLAFLLALGLVTGRGLGSLVGPRERLWRDMGLAFVPMAALGLGLLPLITQDASVTALQSPLTLLAWLPLALPLLLATAGCSEIIFRGFLQQQLAARWGASWVWMGLPAALFALLQSPPAAAGGLAPLTLLWALAFSAAAADLTARTGGLGAAIGLQAGLQAQSLFFVALKGPMIGLALYGIDARGAALLPWVAADFLMLLVGWLSARLLLRV